MTIKTPFNRSHRVARRIALQMTASLLTALLCAAPGCAQELLKPNAAWQASTGQNAAPQLSRNGTELQVEAGAASKADPAIIEQNLGEPRAGLYRFRVRLQATTALRVEVRVRLAPRPGTVYGSQTVSLQPNQPADVSGFALVPDLQNDALFQIALLQPGTLRVLSSSLSRIEEADLSAEEKRALAAQMGPKLPPVDEKKLLAETDARIQKYRTGPLTIRVVDAQGKPLANRKVSVKHLRHDFKFGTLLRERILPGPDETLADKREREALLRLFNYATISIKNTMKQKFPGGPKPSDYNYEDLMPGVRWLKANGITPRGHVAVWNTPGVVPGWIAKTPQPIPVMRRVLDAHLASLSKTLLPEFADADVWNEPVQFERWENPLTQMMRQEGTVPLLTEYLKTFKRLNPDVAAVVNDFDSTPAFYDLLRQLIENGAPVDIIGQQTHGGLSKGPKGLWNLLEQLSLLKRPILLSELSVMSGQKKANGTWGASTPEGEARQAEETETFYRLAYSHPNVMGVVIWNLSDNKAWKNAPRGFLRTDGTPKPSFFRLDNLINKQWRTNGEFTTRADGTVVVPNAFEGEYEITSGAVKATGKHDAKTPLRVEIKTG